MSDSFDDYLEPQRDGNADAGDRHDGTTETDDASAELIARLAAGDDSASSEASEISPPQRPVAADAAAFSAAAAAGAITTVDSVDETDAPKGRGRRRRSVSDSNAAAAKIRRGRSTADETPVSSAGSTASVPRTVPLTSFDFLGGEFERARKARLVSIGLIGAVGVVSLFLMQMAVGAYLGRQSVARDVDSLRAEHLALTAEYNELTTIGGVTAVELDAHIGARTSELDASAGAEVDTVAIVREFLQNPVADSTITAVKLSASGATASADGGESGSTTTTTVADDAPEGSVIGVSISISVDTREALAAWLSRVETLPGFTYTYQSTNAPTTVEVTGSVPVTDSGRYLELIEAITPSTSVSDAVSTEESN